MVFGDRSMGRLVPGVDFVVEEVRVGGPVESAVVLLDGSVDVEVFEQLVVCLSVVDYHAHVLSSGVEEFVG